MNTNNIAWHQNFYEIRYLLHGDRDHYDSQETLYVSSQLEQSNLWVKVAKAAGIETWCILNSTIADTISRDKWDNLGIKDLKPSNILDRIQPELIEPRLLSAQEREELLRQSFNRPELWRSLKLHETTTGSFTQINDHTYRVNPTFDLDPLLAEAVILVQNTQRPDWIPEWTPQTAINFIVRQSNPEQYAEILLKLLPQATDEQMRILRATSWLPLQSGGLVSPKNVVFFSDKRFQTIEERLEKILSVNKISNFVTLSMLPADVRNALKAQRTLRDICDEWSDSHILSFLLDTAYFPDASSNCSLILDTLKILLDRNQTVSNDNFIKLQTTTWLLDIDDRPITPQQVINYPELNRELTEILAPKEIRGICDYITPSLLQNDISICLNDAKLKDLFTSGESALQQIGVVISLVDNYWIGDLVQDNLDVRDFLRIFDGFSKFPILTLAKKISEDQFREHILSQILKPISDFNLLNDVLNWITDKYASASNQSVRFFNKYLTLSCKHPQFRDEILPNIKLLNVLGQWKNTCNLCDEKVATGIISESILNSEQRDILAEYLDSNFNASREATSSDFTSSNDLSYSTNDNATILEEYFRPWLPYISSEIIGLFVCQLTGSDSQTKQLAEGYLQRRNFEELRDRLVFHTDIKNRQFVIKIAPDTNQTIEVRNLLGNDISVTQVSIDNLEHIFVGELTRETTQIFLRKFSITSANSHKLSDILLESIKRCESNIAHRHLQSIDDIWKDISTSKQLDIEVARKYILRDLRYKIEILGSCNRNAKLKQKFKKWSELQYDISVEERQKKGSKKQEEIENIIAEIENLVANDPDIGNDILESIRHKIGHGQFGYHSNSIPFELFQNADDALTELLDMTNHVLEDDRKKTFVLEISDEGLRIMHWGRPINVFKLPNAMAHNDFSDRGFDRDLLKMLSFNISDKSDNVTGKFGLGFKSVYLICNEPKVISGDMSFSIESGLLPVALPRTNEPEKAEQDYQLIENFKESLTEIVPKSDALGGTLIDLAFAPSLNINPQEITHEFKTSLGLLLAFSRSLKKCKFDDRSQDMVVEIDWNATNLFNSNCIAVGQIMLNNEQGWQTHNNLCFQLDDAAIAIVFPENLSDKRSPLKDLPTFWVTAPTKKKLGLRFAINGKFDITTGRTSLDSNSPNNLAIAQNIGEGLAGALIHIFDCSQTTLAPLIEALKIDNNVSAYDFWQFIWEVLAVDWLKKDLEESERIILKSIFGQGIGQLISRHRSLPNGLSASYQCLVSLPEVEYVLQGFISKQEYKSYFEKMTTWSGFQSHCPPTKIINDSNWELVKKLLGNPMSNNTFPKIKFHEILSWEIGEEDINYISPDQALFLGELLTDDLLNNLQTSEWTEYQEIKTILKTLVFLNKKGDYIHSSYILISDAQQGEEQLLAAFAPDDSLLHEDYIDSGKSFFLVCRGSGEKISFEKMTSWAIHANTSSERKNAVLEYLNKGERKQTFTEILKNSITGTWMEHDQSIQTIFKINAYQLRVNEAIEGIRSWDQITVDSNDLAGYISNNDDYEPDDIVLVNPDDLLRTISQWWQDNYSQEINNYNQRLYPIEFNDLRNRIREDDRSAWMMLFFLGFTHKMGRTKHEAHRNFIRFCLDNGWWDIFSRPYPQNFHSEWMSVLDQYIDPQVDRTQWNYWMEKFPSIYRIARYLDQYIHIFRTIDKHNLINLSQIIAPAINPAFQGSTLNAPPLNLSIGVNFVIRELVRLGVIQRTEQVIQHCFVPRYNVRRLLTYLGCSGLDRPEPTYSRLIASFLAEKINELQLNISPTFENAFDIPFELYSEDSRRVGHLPLDSLTIREDDDLSDEEN